MVIYIRQFRNSRLFGTITRTAKQCYKALWQWYPQFLPLSVPTASLIMSCVYDSGHHTPPVHTPSPLLQHLTHTHTHQPPPTLSHQPHLHPQARHPHTSTMAMSGVKLDESCMTVYNEIQKGKKHLYAVFIIKVSWKKPFVMAGWVAISFSVSVWLSPCC